MKSYLKLYTIYALRIFLRTFYIFPVKRTRLLFCSFNGNSFNCNPKYIFIHLYEEYGAELDFVWCIDDSSKIPSTYHVKCVKYLSLKHVYYLMTSQIIISNQPIEPFLPKRGSQLFINTTHGPGAYKKGGVQSTNLSKSLRYCMMKMKYIRSKMIDNVISSCKTYTDIFSTEIEYNISKDKFLPYGMPRNDIFFNCNRDAIKKKVCETLGLDGDAFMIIYAPTYRGHYNYVEDVDLGLNVQMLLDCVQDKFKKQAILLFRHHIAAKRMNVMGKNVIDVSEYQDMQELLVASDMFITDYSSCLWDFSLSYKPGFLYVPDLKKYESETDFHTPIELWPFPYSLTMNDLCWQITNYDRSKAEIKINNHLQLLGSYETGSATKKTVEFVIGNIKNS